MVAIPEAWVPGMILPFWPALLLTTLASTMGEAIPLLVGRRFRKPVLQLPEQYQTTQAVLRVGTFKAVWLARLALMLAPAPRWLDQYIIDFVPFWPYIFGCFVATTPGNVMDVLIGQNMKSLYALLKGEHIPPGQLAYQLVALIASTALFIIGVCYARREFRRIEEKKTEAAAVAERMAAAAAGNAQCFTNPIQFANLGGGREQPLSPDQAVLSLPISTKIQVAVPEKPAPSQSCHESDSRCSAMHTATTTAPICDPRLPTQVVAPCL